MGFLSPRKGGIAKTRFDIIGIELGRGGDNTPLDLIRFLSEDKPRLRKNSQQSDQKH